MLELDRKIRIKNKECHIKNIACDRGANMETGDFGVEEFWHFVRDCKKTLWIFRPKYLKI